MPKLYKKILFIFRRDFRLYDNTALIQACQQADVVVPIFIFDPRQIGEYNEFRSFNAIQFMLESLADLDEQLAEKKGRLYRFYGIAEDIIEVILQQEKFDAVVVNVDYTPFSLKRDDALAHVCRKMGVHFCQYHDLLLNEPERVKKVDNTPYSKFTPFFNVARKIPVQKPQSLPTIKFEIKKIMGEKSEAIDKKILSTINKNIHVHGGRKQALNILRSLTRFDTYDHEHDIPAVPTTNLSAHLKFGTVSVREVFEAIEKTLGYDHPLIRQLYWRDFYSYVAYHSPFVFGHSFQQKYENLVWDNDMQAFNAWAEGKTGFPLVDAGMRQLNKTGFMPNRVRMLVASFLIKDLHIHWLWGEKYFAQKLVDYDPAVNNGNWQWVASTGCDAQPYFRIFNPWLQQKKFDPESVYIKRWIPELKDIKPRIIHTWHNQDSLAIKGYPRPMLDHGQESMIAQEQYRAL